MSMAEMQSLFDPSWLEGILLELGDLFDIRVSWNRDNVVLTGVFAVAGGVVGSYVVGGRLWTALGASIGGVTGYGVSTMVSLREIWTMVKDKLQELLYILFNQLRRVEPVDVMHAFEILMASTSSRRELVIAILDFIATKLGREVTSNFISS